MTSQMQGNEKVDLSDSNIDNIEEVVRTVAASTNYLNLQSNQLSNLSPALSIFSKLTVLDLSHNQLVSIESITVLENLQTLGLANNNLTTEAINQGNLSALLNLQKLNLNGNEITEFPLSLCYVKQLTHLGLAENLIEEIPQEITELFYLCFLSLKNNQIRKCQIDFSKLVLLRGVSLYGNPILDHDLRASSRLFHHVPLLQYGETTGRSNISINQIADVSE